MVSFLRKLRGEGVVRDEKDQATAEGLKGVVQLEIDVYQTESEIAIYAPCPGAEIENIDISIEGDNDVLTIKGTKNRPEKAAFPRDKVHKGQFFSEECVWGDFYRQIILPEAIDVDKAEAKFRSGVLIIVLPLLRSGDRKKYKMKVANLDDGK